MARKRKLTEKQENTIKKMKETRQIDSNNLRQLIIAKKDWAIKEIQRGKIQQQNIQITIHRLEGIVTFINDLIEPVEKESK